MQTLNSAEVGDENKLFLTKIRMKVTLKHHLDKIAEEKFIVESL